VEDQIVIPNASQSAKPNPCQVNLQGVVKAGEDKTAAAAFGCPSLATDCLADVGPAAFPPGHWTSR